MSFDTVDLSAIVHELGQDRRFRQRRRQDLAAALSSAKTQFDATRRGRGSASPKSIENQQEFCPT